MIEIEARKLDEGDIAYRPINAHFHNYVLLQNHKISETTIGVEKNGNVLNNFQACSRRL